MRPNWFFFAASLIGTFFATGIAAWVAANFFNIWKSPAAGFTAAFSVVAVAYTTAPKHKLHTSTLVFVFGATFAWLLLKDSYYPESSPLAYEPTLIPLIWTLAGGFLALVLVAAIHVYQRPRV